MLTGMGHSVSPVLRIAQQTLVDCELDDLSVYGLMLAKYPTFCECINESRTFEVFAKIFFLRVKWL